MMLENPRKLNWYSFLQMGDHGPDANPTPPPQRPEGQSAIIQVLVKYRVGMRHRVSIERTSPYKKQYIGHHENFLLHCNNDDVTHI